MEITVEKYKEMQEFFRTKKYLVIRNFLDSNMNGLIYQYCLAKVQQIDFKTTYSAENYHPDWDGNFNDSQAPGCYSSYADILMETILAASRPAIEKYIGLELLPNYSYWRLYQKGIDLKRHRDRHSCEISITLCLGYNTSNLDPKEYPDYDWPMWVETDEFPGQDGAPVHLKPGDMIIYRGCEVDHWREPFLGLNHAQVFLHYNDKNGPLANMLDGRPIIGVPKEYQKNG
jgi:hypothetical protein